MNQATKYRGLRPTFAGLSDPKLFSNVRTEEMKCVWMEFAAGPTSSLLNIADLSCRVKGINPRVGNRSEEKENASRRKKLSETS
jgi:hypothetical protein